jgi:hypothetical protein
MRVVGWYKQKVVQTDGYDLEIRQNGVRTDSIAAMSSITVHITAVPSKIEPEYGNPISIRKDGVEIISATAADIRNGVAFDMTTHSSANQSHEITAVLGGMTSNVVTLRQQVV